MIPLARPDIDESDVEAVVQVLRSGQLVQGERVAEFEAAVGAHTGGGEVIAVSNCTAALQLALLALEIGPGHEVGVATFSWPATANAIVQCGATPVFIDIEPVTLGMDPEALERTLHSGRRLSALLPVHAFGNMANMPAISEIADAARIPIIEDAACALGASLDGRPAGSWGRIGCFSFHPRKAATTGEGGALRTSDPRLARKLRCLRNHGADPDSRPPDFIAPGFNMRLTEFQAALGTSQLSRYRKLIDDRRKCAGRYDDLLKDLPLSRPQMLHTSAHIYQSYVLQLDDCDESRRNRLISSLKNRGVETNIGTHHMPMLSYYRQRFGHAVGDFPVTDQIAASSMALPLYFGLTPDDQQTVVETLSSELSHRT